MSKFTNLTLGTNWGQDEWPTHVFVFHERFWESEFRTSVKYVPERICRDVHKEGFFQCSICGCTVQLKCDFEPTLYAGKAIVPNYCPNCGAKVVE